MKKLLCLILCLVMGCTMLVGCGEGEIGDYIKNYPENPQTTERLNLNLYIITGDSTTENAKVSVATRIAGHTKNAYNTVLNVHYVKASEYEATVSAAIRDGGENMPHIVLISSKAMYDSLTKGEGGNKLVDLTAFYKTKDYGRLNTQISNALLSASKEDGKFYTVPNNRVIGEYEYLVVNKLVRDSNIYSNKDIAEFANTEDVAALVETIRAEIVKRPGFTAEMAEELVYTVSGSYEMRNELSKENFCVVTKAPVVTAEDAYLSGFAIVNNLLKYNERAMQMIYAINTDLELRNLLQYGVQGANYNLVDGDVVRIIDDSNTYEMNLYHTGDVFKAIYCSEFGWTQAAYDYGIIHTKDSLDYRSVEKAELN